MQATRRSGNLYLAENGVSQNKKRRALRGGGGGKCTLRAKEIAAQHPDGEHYHALLFLLIPPPLPCIPGRGTGDIALFFHAPLEQPSELEVTVPQGDESFEQGGQRGG